MIKAMISLIIIQLYVTNTVCNESNESELLEEIQCPGNICGEKCCTEPGYICCNNNLFCAREVKYCIDYEVQPTMFVMFNESNSFINLTMRKRFALHFSYIISYVIQWMKLYQAQI